MRNALFRLFLAVLVLSALVGLFAPLTGCVARPTMFYNYYCFDTGQSQNANRAPSVTHYRGVDESGWGFEQGYTPGYTNGRAAAPAEGQW